MLQASQILEESYSMHAHMLGARFRPLRVNVTAGLYNLMQEQWRSPMEREGDRPMFYAFRGALVKKAHDSTMPLVLSWDLDEAPEMIEPEVQDVVFD